MKKFAAFLFIALLSGCLAHFGPPKFAYESWYAPGKNENDVRNALVQCNYKDSILVGPEIINQQNLCMSKLGYRLDESSFGPDNCYGSAPAGCNKYWHYVNGKFIAISP